MNAEQLKRQYPHIFNEIVKTGYQEGLAEETQRIEAINSLPRPQQISPDEFAEIIARAKDDKHTTAGDIAVRLLAELENISDIAHVVSALKKNSEPYAQVTGAVSDPDSDLINSYLSRAKKY
ncbi:hypothetical protein [Bacillus sp. SJS]|uniref:hypothetical protein n=1 Tax=Bacillus sp. SJS TaxID=1423321 RepID=UPI0004DCBA42|nr:hypothetical protein [Bacillus sp. SJS]KZZ82515.1 hypothetical protein AS29_020705 [Bacillus sp. SJS]